MKQLADKENWNKFLRNYKVMKLNIVPFNVLEKSSKGSFNRICQDYDLFQYLKYINELHNI